MSSKPTPYIKGVFLKSHINAVAKARGSKGLKQLELCYGKQLTYKNLDDVPVRDEIKLLECAIQIISDKLIDPSQLSYEAGRLHFVNFSTTPLAKFVLPFFRNNFKRLMLGAKHLAGHVFRGVEFSTEELGEKSVALTMANADYHIDHFRGLLQAWMEYCGLQGTIQATELKNKTYKYNVKWD
ncbi:MAG TPA: DUF2378 family protein [Patescibacteria group bacterium]